MNTRVERLAKLSLELKGGSRGSCRDVNKGRLPLTSSQKGILLNEATSGKRGSIVVCEAYRLYGTIDFEALIDSISAVVRRHPALRTRLHVENDVYEQQILDHDNVCSNIKLLDLAEIANQEYYAGEFIKGFSAEPLLKDSQNVAEFVIIRSTIASQFAVLCLKVHHSVCDGVSLQVLYDDICEYYSQYKLGTLPVVDAYDMAYCDCISSEAEWLASDDAMPSRRFWMDSLGDYRCDNTEYSAITSDEMLEESLAEYSVDRDISEEIYRICKDKDITGFTLLVGLIAQIIFRNTGKRDVLIGSIIGSREYIEERVKVGCFTNTILLRVDAGESDGPLYQIEVAKNMVALALEHSRVPFEQVARDCNFWKRFRTADIADITINFHSEPASGLHLDEVTTRRFALPSPAPKRRLTLHIYFDEEIRIYVQSGNNVSAELKSNIGRSLVGAFHAIAAGSSPSAKNECNRQSKLDSLVERRGPEILARFQDHARKLGMKRCVTYLGESKTYAEIDQESKQAARSLIGLGIAPGSLIGVHLERGINHVVWILAILRIGCGYVAIDASYPAETKVFMIENSKIDLLLVDGKYNLSIGEGIKVLDIRMKADAISEYYFGELVDRAKPDDIAYVLYTSGSSGKPKGVKILFRNIDHYITAMLEAIPIEEADTYLHTASFSFSSSVRQLFLPLCRGATIVIADTEIKKEPLRLFDLISKERITIIDFVPSLLRACALAIGSEDDSEIDRIASNTLRLILSASETLSPDTARRVYSTFSKNNPLMINMYGQTETAGIVATHRLSKSVVEANHIIPIGKPIGNNRILIVDDKLKSMPLGEIGEICVLGDTVGAGYLNSDGSTKERFLYGEWDGRHCVLYRTGDRGKYDSSGNIVLLGRIDNEVKIRGHRVGLDEVGTIIEELDGVQRCCARTYEDDDGFKRIALFIECQDSITDNSLLKWANERLPVHMRPSRIAIMATLPKTANGKIDLGHMDQTLMEILAKDRNKNYDPNDTVASRLVSIWRSVLCIEDIGVDDNIFDLGGDSISMIQICSRAKAQGIAISPGIMLRNQTISAICNNSNLMVQKPNNEDDLGSVGDTQKIPLLQSQWRYIINNMGTFQNDAIVSEKRVATKLGVSSVKGVVLEVLAGIPEFKLRICEEDGWMFQRPDPKYEIDESHIEELQVGGDNAIIKQESTRQKIVGQIDCRFGPIVHGAIFPLGGGEIRVVLAIHRLYVDNISWRNIWHWVEIGISKCESAMAALERPRKLQIGYLAKKQEEMGCPRTGLLENIGTDRGKKDGKYNHGVGFIEDNATHVEVVLLNNEMGRREIEDWAASHSLSLDAVLIGATTRSLAQIGYAESIEWEVERNGRDEAYGIGITDFVGYMVATDTCVATSEKQVDVVVDIKRIGKQVDLDRKIPRQTDNVEIGIVTEVARFRWCNLGFVGELGQMFSEDEGGRGIDLIRHDAKLRARDLDVLVRYDGSVVMLTLLMNQKIFMLDSCSRVRDTLLEYIGRLVVDV